MMDKRIREAIDACRPASADLLHPELSDVAERIEKDPQAAERYRRVQAIDAQIVQAISNVPVPEGLAERLVGRLAESRETGSSPAAVVVARRDRRTGRRWFTGTLAAAAVLVVAVGFAVVYWPARQPLTLDDAQQLAGTWTEQLETELWRPVSSRPATHPASTRVLASPRRWQAVRTAVDRHAVAYDLSPRGGEAVTLFVLRAASIGLGGAPPKQPFWTQGRSIAAWQSGGLVYVLIVDGKQSRYRRYVDPRVPPLACRDVRPLYASGAG